MVKPTLSMMMIMMMTKMMTKMMMMMMSRFTVPDGEL